MIVYTSMCTYLSIRLGSCRDESTEIKQLRCKKSLSKDHFLVVTSVASGYPKPHLTFPRVYHFPCSSKSCNTLCKIEVSEPVYCKIEVSYSGTTGTSLHYSSRCGDFHEMRTKTRSSLVNCFSLF